MLGFYKEKFECLITNIVDDVAFVHLHSTGEKLEESYMEIPFEDLEKYKINCKIGELFTAIFRKWKDWEKMTFIPLVRESVTQKEFDDLKKYHEDKYGDV